MKRLLAVLLLAAAALLPLSTCRSTKHTVARIITPAAVPTEIFVPAPPAPPAPATRVPTFTPAPAPPAVVRTAPPAPRMPSPTPTIAPMRVVTAPAGPPEDRSPGVLYEQYVPTVVASTPVVTPVATATTPVVTPISTRAVSPRSTRPARTPTSAATQKPGVYYEDEEGRPLTPTPQR